jgi:hypothetical protein
MTLSKLGFIVNHMHENRIFPVNSIESLGCQILKVSME